MTLAGPPRSNENGAVALSCRRLCLVPQEPDSKCDAGASGTPNCRLFIKRARTPDSLRGGSPRRREGVPRPKEERDGQRVVQRCCGLDVHKASVTACVRVHRAAAGELHQEIREFAATTRGLLQLRDWLASFRVTLVGMEATGVYWKPVYYLLEEEFECWLLNARHLKNVPGRKTDVKDAAWGSASSLSTGWLGRASCRPKRLGS